MSKYPHVCVYRHDTYADTDVYFQSRDQFECEITLVKTAEDLKTLWNPNYPILVTYGKSKEDYRAELEAILPPRFFQQWIHYTTYPPPSEFSKQVNTLFLNICIGPREHSRPVFSAFTTCYKSYEKIMRPYTTLKDQTLKDWEWILLDDTPGDEHFKFLTETFKDDPRIRLYKRATNSGNIGNVKNEAIGLCRGAYVLELDHDDEIDSHLFQRASEAFERFPEAGFAYTDFIAVYEDGKNQFYGDFAGLGYAGYYMQKYKDVWRYVYVTPQVNNITLSHLVSLPNHARMWRRDVLASLGSYSEYLPINDDQEILMRTCMGTGMIKIPMIGYTQYHNDGGNNFSYIRNREINRLGPQYLVPQFYDKYNVQAVMKERGAYDDERFMAYRQQVWKRTDFVPAWYNQVYLPETDCQYGIIGRKAFLQNLEQIKEIAANPRNQVYVLDNGGDSHEYRADFCALLESHGLSGSHIRCYSLKDTSENELIRYFNTIYKVCEEAEVILYKPTAEEQQTSVQTRVLFEFTG